MRAFSTDCSVLYGPPHPHPLHLFVWNIAIDLVQHLQILLGNTILFHTFKCGFIPCHFFGSCHNLIYIFAQTWWKSYSPVSFVLLLVQFFIHKQSRKKWGHCKWIVCLCLSGFVVQALPVNSVPSLNHVCHADTCMMYINTQEVVEHWSWVRHEWYC